MAAFINAWEGDKESVCTALVTLREMCDASTLDCVCSQCEAAARRPGNAKDAAQL